MNTGIHQDDEFLEAEILPAPASTVLVTDLPASAPPAPRTAPRWWIWPFRLASWSWNVFSLILLLAIVAAIPIVQLATLGYLLRAAANLSRGDSWRRAAPGLELAGRLATFALLAGLLWLPIWLVTDLAYSVQLLRPGTAVAAGWRIAAFLCALTWLIWLGWAALRGGRWWHVLWPAPLRFMRDIWRPSTWSRAADKLWYLCQRLHFPALWWLGARAACGALIWVAIPASLMIIGLRAQNLPAAGLLGLLGALSLTWVMLHLPLLQILFAERGRFTALFDLREIRQRFRHAPWALTLALVSLYVLCVPLYLLRIEATPEQLTWLPSLLFVGLMLPAKLLLGAALGYAARRPTPRHWIIRSIPRVLLVVSSLAYVGTLYIAQFVAWQGVYVMYFQHAVLVPVAS